MQPREPSVLMMASEATAQDGRVVARALADDCSVSFSSDVFEAAELLTEANFDALAIACEDEVERTLYLCSHIRNNPRLFNLPILVMADKDSFVDPAVPYQRGASLVLSRPLDPAELHDQVLSLTRRQRTIYNVRRQLADTLCDETRDPPTGLFARPLFASHLSRLIETAGLSQKPLSLVLFEVENVAWFERQFGEAARARALHQVARWIAGLVRAEDMPARVEDSAIAVALPDTGREEALVVAHRIAGVLLNTDFTVEDSKDADPLRVWLGTGTASAEPGDTVDGLIARARSHLR
jgi:two-component system cell cycle response regulator